MAQNKSAPPSSGQRRQRDRNDRCDYFYFFFFIMPDSAWLFLYSAISAALGWPIIGPDMLAAAAGAAGFFALPLAKAPEVETAKIARPTIIIFFMLNSLKKRRTIINHRPWTRVKNRHSGLFGIPGSMLRIAPE